jgi:hydrogenase expression/formation protein HypE
MLRLSLVLFSILQQAEGGLANGLHELSIAAGKDIDVNRDAITISAESQILCEAFHLDPMGIIASGALLIAAALSEAGEVSKKTRETGIPLTEIGWVRSREPSSGTMVTPHRSQPIPCFKRDEAVKISPQLN